MPRHFAMKLALLLGAFILSAAPAGAVVKGSSSSLGSITVRLAGNGNCTGVAIARQIVVTAAHCAHGMRVYSNGGSARIVNISRSGVLDDGRRVSVSGDAAILKLSMPLAGVSAAPIGEASGDTFTIAGYGTTDERARDAFGALHEATLIAIGARALVDPHRTGLIGASACFGDSGGPVMRGGMLVGVITRAAHPSPRMACGDLTRWAAITVSGTAVANASPTPEKTAAEEPQPTHHRRHAKQKKEAETGSVFGNWFKEKTETRRHARKSARRKEAQR